MGLECSTYGRDKKTAYKILIGEPGRKRQLRKPRRKCEDNINPLEPNQNLPNKKQEYYPLDDAFQ
jgi:hypothetical protein